MCAFDHILVIAVHAAEAVLGVRHRASVAVLGAIIAAMVLSGCQTTATDPAAAAESDPQKLPSDYRQQVIEAIKATFKDPYSLRDVTISGPVPWRTSLSNLPTVAVCMMANGKNTYGGYTGRQPTAFMFRNGRVITTDSPYAPDVCQGVTYGPFPEIAQLKSR